MWLKLKNLSKVVRSDLKHTWLKEEAIFLEVKNNVCQSLVLL